MYIYIVKETPANNAIVHGFTLLWLRQLLGVLVEGLVIFGHGHSIQRNIDGCYLSQDIHLIYYLVIN
jgi:hypothetical protein